MAKRKKRLSAGDPQTELRILRKGKYSIRSEAEYIVKRARNRETRVVGLGLLVLFSTDTGDAWILDWEDGFALCLAREGVRLPFSIRDTPKNFSINWNADYRIQGDVFTVAERSGRILSILGYPIQEILKAIRLAAP